MIQGDAERLHCFDDVVCPAAPVVAQSNARTILSFVSILFAKSCRADGAATAQHFSPHFSPHLSLPLPGDQLVTRWNLNLTRCVNRSQNRAPRVALIGDWNGYSGTRTVLEFGPSLPRVKIKWARISGFNAGYRRVAWKIFPTTVQSFPRPSVSMP